MQGRIATVFLAFVLLPFWANGQNRTTPAAEPKTQVPPDCDKPDLLVAGRPILAPVGNDLAIGISLAKQEFRVAEAIVLHIWIDNPGDAPSSFQSCGDIDFFKAYGIELFGADGRRILSRSDKELSEQCKTGYPAVWTCAGNGVIPIPAHTCERMGSVSLNYLFPKAPRNSYALPPGTYTIRLRQDSGGGGNMCKMEAKNPRSVTSGPTLTFSVKHP